MEITAPPSLEKFVKEMLRSGYQLPNKVISDCLRLIMERKQDIYMDREELWSEFATALEQLDRSESRPREEVFAELREKLTKCE